MTHGLAGRPKSPEHRAKLSASLKGKKLPDDHRAKLLEAAKRPKSLEHRAAIAESNRKRAETPERKAQLARAHEAARSRMLERAERGEPQPWDDWVWSWYCQVGDELRNRDGDLCQLCLCPINFSLPRRDPQAASVDDVIPTYAGGSNDRLNLWLSHLRCNQSKGARFVGRPDGSTDVRKAA